MYFFTLIFLVSLLREDITKSALFEFYLFPFWFSFINSPPVSSSRVSMDSEDSKAILGELCALAPSTEVRDCLRLYKPQASYKQLDQIFSRVQVGHLSESLFYLIVRSTVSFRDMTKEGLICKLIFRMHNLIPDTCKFCNETYSLSKDSPSLLPCENCGQDVHPACLASKLETDVANIKAE